MKNLMKKMVLGLMVATVVVNTTFAWKGTDTQQAKAQKADEAINELDFDTDEKVEFIDVDDMTGMVTGFVRLIVAAEDNDQATLIESLKLKLTHKKFSAINVDAIVQQLKAKKVSQTQPLLATFTQEVTSLVEAKSKELVTISAELSSVAAKIKKLGEYSALLARAKKQIEQVAVGLNASKAAELADLQQEFHDQEAAVEEVRKIVQENLATVRRSAAQKA